MAALFSEPVYRVVGDRGLLVEFGDAISAEINQRVRVMTAALDKEQPDGIVEVIPTYRSLLIVYDPLDTDVSRLRTIVEFLNTRLDEIDVPSPRLIEVPVAYGNEFGPDIEFVAQTHGLTVDDVIRIHSSATYPIYMIGFTPGFPFLGGLPETLHTPRLETPRRIVPAGSVGIANNQTGIYVVESPGGWRIIGRTPLKLYNPAADEPFVYSIGDMIRFVPISREDFDGIAGRGGF